MQTKYRLDAFCKSDENCSKTIETVVSVRQTVVFSFYCDVHQVLAYLCLKYAYICIKIVSFVMLESCSLENGGLPLYGFLMKVKNVHAFGDCLISGKDSVVG